MLSSSRAGASPLLQGNWYDVHWNKTSPVLRPPVWASLQVLCLCVAAASCCNNSRVGAGGPVLVEKATTSSFTIFPCSQRLQRVWQTNQKSSREPTSTKQPSVFGEHFEISQRAAGGACRRLWGSSFCCSRGLFFCAGIMHQLNHQSGLSRRANSNSDIAPQASAWQKATFLLIGVFV